MLVQQSLYELRNLLAPFAMSEENHGLAARELTALIQSCLSDCLD
jgi:hypothetical protein